MEKSQDIQQRLLDAIKQQLPKGEKLAQVMMDLLNLSQDAVYRRLRGEVPLTIFETKILCETYSISFDDFGTYRKGQVSFAYNQIKISDYNLEQHITSLRDILRYIKNLDDAAIYTSTNDTPIFQILNLPHLTRFKFFYWSKTYLKNPALKDAKFKREKIDKRVLQIGIEALNIYNSIETHEVYGPELLRGTLRQIQYYFDSHLFEDPSYALELIDNLMELSAHLQKQADIGSKYTRGNEPSASLENYKLFANETIITDNTYLVKWKDGKSVYFVQNIINHLITRDPFYIEETEYMLENLMNNSSLVSVANAKDRYRYFGSLDRSIMSFRKHIEAALEI